MTLIGQKFGDRYEIQREIGRGGMAQVYLAFDTRLQRKVALKIMAPQLALHTEFVQRFEREARVAAGLSHPAIVTVYDCDEHQGLLYITMEYIEGRSLHSILREHGVLGMGYAVSILSPIAQALDYAHRAGAVHRDVKPHNMLVSVDGRVLLTDFGIALLDSADRERLTRTGIFIGTPEYISPEQLEAKHVDGASDRYALGVVGYELLTGRVPFSGTTAQLLLAHTQFPPPPLRQIAPHLPVELEEVFERALAKNPHDRFGSSEEFVQEIARILQRHGIPWATRAQIAELAKPRHKEPPRQQVVSLPGPTSVPPLQPDILEQYLRTSGAIPIPPHDSVTRDLPKPFSGAASTPKDGPKAVAGGASPPPAVPAPEDVSQAAAEVVSPRSFGPARRGEVPKSVAGVSFPPPAAAAPEDSVKEDVPKPDQRFEQRRWPAPVWILLFLLLVSGLIALLLLLPQNWGSAMHPTATSVQQAAVTDTPFYVLATDTPFYVLATDTPVYILATDTPSPMPPTDTPSPIPTDTPSPIPTDTPQPVPTDTPQPPPTDTPLPSAGTPTPPEDTVPLPLPGSSELMTRTLHPS